MVVSPRRLGYDGPGLPEVPPGPAAVKVAFAADRRALREKPFFKSK
jgi:hypothetical protein